MKDDNSRSSLTRNAASGAAPAMADDIGPPLEAGAWTSPPARELAQRLNGSDEVLLLWHPESRRVELCIRDLATDVSFQLDVPPGNAIDAFNHPYAYVFKRTNTRPHVVAGIAERE